MASSISKNDLSAADSTQEIHETINALLDQLSRQESSIVEFDAILGRLNQAVSSGEDELGRKALSQAGTQLMMFRMLNEEISQAFEEFRESLEVRMSSAVARRGLDDGRQLNVLSEVADALASSLDPTEILYRAMDSLVSLTGAERAFLMLRNEETGEMSMELSQNFEEDTMRGDSFEVSRTIVDTVVRDGIPVLTTNAAADPRFSAERSIAAHSLRSIVCVPLKTNDDVIGVIYADHRINTAQFNDADLVYLGTFANQASTAIQNARLFENVSVARNLMQNVFESIASGVITTDLNGVVTLFNRAAEKILNVAADNCLELPVFLVLPVLDGLITNAIDQVLGGDGRIIVTEAQGEISQRGKVKLRLTSGPITDAHGEVQGVAVLIEDLTERMRFHKERELVTRYLPKQLVATFSGIGDLQLGGARETVSVFFADICGFTGFSETRDPKRIVDVINTYFGIAGEVIHRNYGIVDKYMGDAVMAHFNSPLLSLQDHAWWAVKTAWEINRHVESFLRTQNSELELKFGIGVNTGEALAGNIGASTRMEYTLIGDAVNVAKRLQEIAGPGQILIGEQTYELVKNRLKAKRIGAGDLKGRDAIEKVYQLVSLSAESAA
mgnify:CR=1 FL=1